MKLAPEDPLNHLSLAAAHYRLGDRAKYESGRARARKLKLPETTYEQACYAALCDEADRAIELLGQALRRREVTKAVAAADPDFYFLRANERFLNMVASSDDARLVTA